MPRPTTGEYEQALHRIHQRRRDAGDDHPLALSEDPREVLAYLRKRGRHGLIEDATGDDITDALTLRLWLYWEGEETELWLLQAAERLGRNRKRIGRVFGFTRGQSLVDRITRIMEKLGRTPATTAAVPASDNDARIRALAVALASRRGEMPPEVTEDFAIDEVADWLHNWPVGAPVPSEGALNALRFLLGALVDVIPAGAPLRDVVDLGVQLVGTRNADVGAVLA